MTTVPDVGKLIAGHTKPATRAQCGAILTALAKRAQAADAQFDFIAANEARAHIDWLLDRMPTE